MKSISLFLTLIFLAFAPGPESSPRYFSHVSNITITDGAPQQYVSIGEDIWLASRNKLGDLRLYDPNGVEVPYKLVVLSGHTREGYSPATILNLGSSNGQTEFLVETEVAQFNRLNLDLKKQTKDFVSKVSIEGADVHDASHWTSLGEYTIYDFSKEDLGGNSTLKLPLTKFRFLRLRIAGTVEPKDVIGASIASLQEEKASWRDIPASAHISTQGHMTTVTWEQDGKVPLENVHLQLEQGDTENFSRAITLSDGNGDDHPLASGEINRVHLRRQGRKIDTENLDLPAHVFGVTKFKVTINNGDDQPLRIRAVRPQAAERRLYFDARGNSALKLYVGDANMFPPVYDYAKLFAEEEVNTMAQLAPLARNPQFSERPDDRAWSDRHTSVLWIAMIAAVAVLGFLAFRSFRGSGSPTNSATPASSSTKDTGTKPS